MKKSIDDLLKQALTPNDAPNFWLNQKILNQVKENPMKAYSKRKRLTAMLVRILVLCFSTVTVFAAWNHLSPDNVSQMVEDNKLAKAFQSKDAISVNETQQYQNMDVTLLGLVSGKNITDNVAEANGRLKDNRTYAVVAIANSDGTPMPKTSEDAYGDLSFFTSPLIEGYDPNLYNAVTMNGGYQYIVEDGILYRISECDNVEMFADHTIYLCVSDGIFYNQDAYQYDASSGKISRNEAYEGVNALFVLPMDADKADPSAAAAYISDMNSDASENDTVASEDAASDDAAPSDDAQKIEIDQWIAAITPDNIDEYAVPVESTKQVLTPDQDGYLNINYEYNGSGSNGTAAMSALFPDNKPGMSSSFGCSYSDNTLEDLTIDTYTLNEDGTVTFLLYIPK
ncbi:MAG: hypothetical protein PHE06_10105 [Lachnospiraceae bacterium]|nr:hypothetical protein [Lachnospiraceae bacterium]